MSTFQAKTCQTSQHVYTNCFLTQSKHVEQEIFLFSINIAWAHAKDSLKPLTDVASKLQFVLAICSLHGGCKQFLEDTTALETCGMTFTCNDLFATYYLQRLT